MTNPPHDPTICENCGGVATHARKALSDAEAMIGVHLARIAELEAERDYWKNIAQPKQEQRSDR